MDKLKSAICWVQLIYDDASVRLIQTTLNHNILFNLGVTAKVNSLFDLNHREYVDFNEHIIEVLVTEEKPTFDDEVINYVNRFI